jgi:hypothetical protein
MHHYQDVLSISGSPDLRELQSEIVSGDEAARRAEPVITHALRLE